MAVVAMVVDLTEEDLPVAATVARAEPEAAQH